MAAWRQQNGSSVSARQPICNEVCRMSNRTRKDFKKGDIIAIPFHEPYLNANVKLPDPSWTYTNHGPVYSKRRMVIVM
jgi:hypothetical protein